MFPSDKASIEEQLNNSFTQFTECINPLNEAQFTRMPNGKWSAGQHLQHLIISAKMVNRALYLPKWLLRILFGKNNRPKRSYEETVAKYQLKLANGGVAPANFEPPKTLTFNQKQQLLNAFAQQQERLIAHLQGLSNQQLDTLLLPHPLLGKITLREMFFFTIYHTQHHTQIILGMMSSNDEL